MSEIKVNKITPRAACGTTQLGDSGDTFTIPSGATIQNLGTATGFGGTGVVSWETSSIKTGPFTAVTGTGYFCNTTGGIFTVTLPLSPSAGDVVGVSDYAQTFDTNNLTLGRNGSNINGDASDSTLTTEGLAVTLVYVDVTKGWIVTDSGLQSDAPGPLYIAATGGCITTCGNFKMHTFTGPDTFVVCSVGNCAGSNTVDYLVVAGGGSGANANAANNGQAGGGGAGGFRESSGAASGCYTASPLGACVAALPVSATPYAITVGGGGAALPANGSGNNGLPSTFSTITSAGGGGGLRCTPGVGPGGSGGGAANTQTLGAGNTPPVSPPQGQPGGAQDPSGDNTAGGGGGATVAGSNGIYPSGPAGPGGAGATSSINTTPTARAGGGGGGGNNGETGGGTGGTGGGGAGGNYPLGPGTNGVVNTGGGGGASAAGPGPSGISGGGGSGIVIIRYKYQ